MGNDLGGYVQGSFSPLLGRKLILVSRQSAVDDLPGNKLPLLTNRPFASTKLYCLNNVLSRLNRLRVNK